MKHALILIVAASAAGGQGPLRGIAYDSLHGRPLSGAFVGIAGLSVSAMSDSLGRFVLPAVPKGTHRVVMQHDVLDAIGISAAGARAVVTDGRDSVIVAVPSFATLWRAACGTQTPGVDTGFVFGTVVRGGRPVPLATVAASWIDLYVDSTKAVRQKQKLMEADADSAGNFALCGVPTTTGLSLRANVGSSFGVWTDVAPLDNERIARRDLTIIAVSPMRFDVPTTTAFSGRVTRDSTDLPVADAEVILADVGLTARTNERGEFRITGVTPGAHMVQVRKIGYTFSDQQMEFAGGAPTVRNLAMSRITTLDSLNVTARPMPPDEAMRTFDEHRKTGLGKFITRAELEKQRDRRMSDIVAQFPGVSIMHGKSGQAYLGSRTPVKSIRGEVCQPIKQDDPDDMRRPYKPCPEACYARIFVDGVQISQNEMPNINRIDPAQLEGVEYYRGGAQLPIQYNVLNARCGVLVLHTRRGKSL